MIKTAFGGVSFKDEEFLKRNKATMKTSRELNDKAEEGSIDLRYAYKLMPPGSRNFFATAWEQTWGNNGLEKNVSSLLHKKPVIAIYSFTSLVSYKI